MPMTSSSSGRARAAASPRACSPRRACACCSSSARAGTRRPSSPTTTCTASAPLLYDPVAGPGPGHPRVLDGAGVVDAVSDPWAWGLNAMAVGGGTRVWQGMSWRFLPEDFAMATRYGVPEGSTLSDWPLGYDELEPYYDRVEWEIGVSGASAGPLTDRFARSRPYPMPPLRDDAIRARVRRRGRPARLGLRACAVRDQQRAARRPCRVRALLAVPRPRVAGERQERDPQHGDPARGRERQLRPAGARAGRRHRARGAPSGSWSTALERTVRCDRVVVCAGAVETPRLLLASGLGNDVVGTNLHSHSFVMLYGAADEPLERFEGPGHSVATLGLRAPRRRGVGRRRAVRRAVAAAGPGRAGSRRSSATRCGARATRRGCATACATSWVAWASARRSRPRAPRVTLDPAVRDVHGMPVARLHGDVHPATIEVRDYMERAPEHVARRSRHRATGSSSAPAARRPPRASTPPAPAAMGDDPATSACDRFGRVHGSEHVYVADASLLNTNGA